jgi:hypothetical protein
MRLFRVAGKALQTASKHLGERKQPTRLNCSPMQASPRLGMPCSFYVSVVPFTARGQILVSMAPRTNNQTRRES